MTLDIAFIFHPHKYFEKKCYLKIVSLCNKVMMPQIKRFDITCTTCSSNSRAGCFKNEISNLYSLKIPSA